MSQFHFYFLGDTRIELGTDTDLPIRAHKQMALLAWLLLHRDREHSREKLATLLWPEMPGSDARNNLRVSLTQLKKVLSRYGASCITATRNSIYIDPALNCQVDVLEFSSLVEQTRQHEHSSRSSCTRCQYELTNAIRLYRGNFLRNITLDDCEQFAEWRHNQQLQLQEQMISALDDMAEHLQNNSNYTQSEHCTRLQLDLDPLRESTHRRLMRLYFFQNKRNAALTHYTSVETLLLDELGVAPEEDTRMLFEQIESEEFEKPVILTPPDSHYAPTNNLPVDQTRFIGNDAELEQLTIYSSQHRLITFTGLGGIGKSRLAIQLARLTAANYPDGVYLVRLIEAKNTSQIVSAIAAAIKFEPEPGGDSKVQLFHYLKVRKILLILDNFEHLLDSRELIASLLAQTSNLTVIVTSRQKLMISGEAIYQVRGMRTRRSPGASGNTAHSAAGALFLDTAARVRMDFNPDARDLLEIERISDLVQGHPLALILAAGWLDSLSCKEIADEITNSIDILRTELFDIPDRQRSVDATCNYSWQLLSADEQLVFASLSVFHGTFTRVAANKVANASIADLRKLAGKSLLQRVSDSGCYEIHELMRQFAERRLREMDCDAVVLESHSEYYLSMLMQWSDSIRDSQPVRNNSAIDIDGEYGNFRAAWQHSLKTSNMPRLKASLNSVRVYCTSCGHEHDLAAFVEALLELRSGKKSVGVQDQNFELSLLLALGVAYRNTKGFTDPALTEIFERAHILIGNMENTPELFAVLYGLWSFNIVRGNLAECEKIVSLWQSRLEHFTSCDTESYLQDACFVVHFLLGPINYLKGNFIAARETMEAGLAMDAPDRHSAIVATYGLNFAVSGRFWLSQVQCICGSGSVGLATAREMEKLANVSGQPLSQAFAALGLCLVGELLHLPEGTTSYTNKLTGISSEHRISQFFVHHGTIFAASALALQNPTEGITTMIQCLKKGIGSKNYFDSDSLLLANALLREKKFSQARDVLEQSLRNSSATGLIPYLAETYRVLGDIEVLQGNGNSANSKETSTYHEKAIQTARQQGARLFELRALVSRDKGRAGPYDDLQKLLQTFSDDEPSADVKSARTLLHSFSDSDKN